MGKYYDITGQKFGLLTAIRRVDFDSKFVIYEFLCECGNIKNIRKSSVISGSTISCGCVYDNKKVDIAGMIFNDIQVIKYFYSKNGIKYWQCKCHCGNTFITRGNSIKYGKTRSCGCIRNYVCRKPYHGGTGTSLFSKWKNMRMRCLCASSTRYKDYGGRGITVCDEWKNNFETFRDWSFNNGYNDNLTIERIDVNGNYEPSNCKWIPLKEQANNTRKTRYIEHNGEKLKLKEFAEKYNLKYGSMRDLYYRHKLNPQQLIERSTKL